MTIQKHILIVDDILKNIQLLGTVLRDNGYEVSFATSGAQALDSVKQKMPALILLDINMPIMDGFEVCHQLKASPLSSTIPIIFLTSNNDISKITEGLELGASDYITKPFNNSELLARVKTHLTIYSLQLEQSKQNDAMRHKARIAMDMLQDARQRQCGPLLGSSAAVEQLNHDIFKVSKHHETVLLQAESGCGTEYVARTIHDQSDRQNNPFIYVNCSQISQTNSKPIFSISSEQSSKINLASGGTLYLDRINKMPIDIQKEFIEHIIEFLGKNIRLISFSSVDLKDLVYQKKFSPELYSYITKNTLPVPSLKSRSEDIPELSEFYLKHFSSHHGKNINSLSPESISALQAYSWPGNLNELISIIESQVVVCSSSTLNINPSVFNKGAGIGNYHMKQKIASGGMGDIWEVEHKLIGRKAALKLIQLNDQDREKNQLRFYREAKAITKLDSPHTIKIYDFGIQNNGAFYYIMELLKGFDLEKLVNDSEPISPPRMIAILKQCCYALVEAHHHGIIHRDIKPANIFICRYKAQYDFVKILDFGIAKSTHDENSLELTGQSVIGSPGFMAPEAFLNHADLTPAADIYALACVAYWSLSHKMLFYSKSPITYYAAHAQTPPPLLSEFSGRSDIPQALDDLLLKCLVKKPAERISSHTLLKELIRLESLHPWTYAESRESWPRHSKPQ